MGAVLDRRARRAALAAAGGLVDEGTRQARQLARKAAPVLESARGSVSAEVRDARHRFHHSVVPVASSAAERAVGSIEQAAQAAQPHVAHLAGLAGQAADRARGAMAESQPLSRLAGLAADGLEHAVEAARPGRRGGRRRGARPRRRGSGSRHRPRRLIPRVRASPAAGSVGPL